MSFKKYSRCELGNICQYVGLQAENAWPYLVKVPPQYNSQKCSGCGEIIKKSLSVRTHICLLCGLVLCRDENASRNIIKLGLDKANGEGIPLGSLLTRRTP